MKTFFVTLHLCNSEGTIISNIPHWHGVGLRGENEEDVRAYLFSKGIPEEKANHPEIFKSDLIHLFITEISSTPKSFLFKIVN